MFRSIFLELLGRETLIAADDTWMLLAVLCLGVTLAISLEQKYTWASKISGAILALIFALVLSNLSILPVNSPLYDEVIWGFAVPLGIPLLLLQCNMRKVWKQTGRMMVIFLIGAVGTCVGAVLAYTLLHDYIPGLNGIAAMMTGSYIGGGVNFAAMASAWGVAGTDVTAAATVADNLLMALYFFMLIVFAGMKFMRAHFRHPHIEAVERGDNDGQTQAAAFWSRKDISLKDIAFNFAYAIVVVWVSRIIGGLFEGLVPENPNAFMSFVGTFFGSQYVWITTISVIIATFASEKVEKMHGSQEIGTYLIYLFLFVIGVPANIMTVITKSPLLLVLCFIMVVVNMLFCFISAKVVNASLEDAIIASNANIGGPTTAAGMAISQGWTALVGPAMLVGVLGYVIGNYAGTVIGMICGA